MYLELYDSLVDRTWPSGFSSHDVTTSFGTGRAYRYGDGAAAPIVLLPPVMATSVYWGQHAAALADGRPVYSVDIAGDGGRSVLTRPCSTPQDAARWLDEVLHSLGVRSAHLVGLSLGGWIAVNQAVRAPERIASVTLLEPGEALVPANPEFFRRVMAVAANPTEEAMLEFARWQAASEEPDRTLIPLMLAAMAEAPPNPPAAQRIEDGDWKAIPVPVLALFGDRSPVIDGPAALSRLRAVLPEARAELVPGGHALPVEQLTGRILEFIRANDPS